MIYLMHTMFYAVSTLDLLFHSTHTFPIENPLPLHHTTPADVVPPLLVGVVYSLQILPQASVLSAAWLHVTRKAKKVAIKYLSSILYHCSTTAKQLSFRPKRQARIHTSMAQNLRQVCALFLLMLSVKSIVTATDDIFQFINAPVPEVFTVGDHYPSRNETEECRPIRLRIARNSHQYLTNLVVNSNPHIVFSNSDARVMTSRLQSRLNSLAVLYYEQYEVRITVLRAWVEYSDDDGIGDQYSLHYEGMGPFVYTPSQSVTSEWHCLI